MLTVTENAKDDVGKFNYDVLWRLCVHK